MEACILAEERNSEHLLCQDNRWKSLNHITFQRNIFGHEFVRTFFTRLNLLTRSINFILSFFFRCPVYSIYLDAFDASWRQIMWLNFEVMLQIVIVIVKILTFESNLHVRSDSSREIDWSYILSYKILAINCCFKRKSQAIHEICMSRFCVKRRKGNKEKASVTKRIYNDISVLSRLL